MKPKPHARKRLVILLALAPCLFGACASPEILNSYERDELIAVKHNSKTDCTLLIYRDPRGQTHHVFRKHGVYELSLTFTPEGGFALHERGGRARVIEATEAHRVTKRINDMLDVKEAAKEQLSSTARTSP